MNAIELLRRSPICSLLGIEFPVLQAGMGQVAYGKLAAAVSAAGGLGVIGAGFLTGAELKREIDVVRATTDKPFGVDILFARVEGSDSASQNFTAQVEDQIAVTLEEEVPVIISGLGNPMEVVDAAHARGMVVMSVVGNVRQAERLAASGVDAIIASGLEGGGHVGRVGTVSLVPQVVDAIDLPVVAGGGIADGRGLVAALALGAVGIWIGTRFIATVEARAHDNYKAKLVEIDEEGTAISRGHSGKTVRMVRNAFTAYWDAHGEDIQPFPLQLEAVGERAAVLGRIEGDVEHGVLPAGQGGRLIDRVEPAGDIVRQIVADAVQVLENWSA